MKVVIDIPEEVYNNMVVKNEYTSMDVIAVHNALIGAKRIPERKEELYYPRSEYEIAVNEGYNKCIDEIIEADTTRDCKTCGHSNDGKCAGTEECHDCMWVNNYIEADIGALEDCIKLLGGEKE